MKILIVDDSAVIRERLCVMLAELEESVDLVGEAEDVQGAFDSIAQLKPDMVILDIKIPGGSGIEVLHGIKKTSPSPVVMMLTNYSYPQYRKRCTDAGANYFFDKSTEFEEVKDVCRLMAQQMG